MGVGCCVLRLTFRRHGRLGKALLTPIRPKFAGDKQLPRNLCIGKHTLTINQHARLSYSLQSVRRRPAVLPPRLSSVSLKALSFCLCTCRPWPWSHGDSHSATEQLNNTDRRFFSVIFCTTLPPLRLPTTGTAQKTQECFLFSASGACDTELRLRRASVRGRGTTSGDQQQPHNLCKKKQKPSPQAQNLVSQPITTRQHEFRAV
jgi:hypothetical protein